MKRAIWILGGIFAIMIMMMMCAGPSGKGGKLNLKGKPASSAPVTASNTATSPEPAPTGSSGSDPAPAVDTTAVTSEAAPVNTLERYLGVQFGFFGAQENKWEITRDAQGNVTVISGGLIAAMGKDKESAYRLVQELAGHLGLRPQDISPEATVQDTHPQMRMFTFNQSYEKYSVYESSISVVARTQDGAVYMINNSLKPVSSTVSMIIRVNAKEAAAVLQAKYKDQLPKIALALTVPVIWASGNDQELSWVFRTEISLPKKDILRCVVGASSGKILHERSDLMSDPVH